MLELRVETHKYFMKIGFKFNFYTLLAKHS
jgi:hypothetical protein